MAVKTLWRSFYATLGRIAASTGNIECCIGASSGIIQPERASKSDHSFFFAFERFSA
jgi:hypothetical protein